MHTSATEFLNTNKDFLLALRLQYNILLPAELKWRSGQCFFCKHALYMNLQCSIIWPYDGLLQDNGPLDTDVYMTGTSHKFRRGTFYDEFQS